MDESANKSADEPSDEITEFQPPDFSLSSKPMCSARKWANQMRFLEEFAKCGVITESARRAGIVSRSHEKWMQNDPTYPERFELAKAQASDRIELEAFRRGIEGYKEPVFFQGQVVGEVTKYSDRMLEMALKGARPDKYRENIDVRLSTTELDAAIERGLAAVAARSQAQITQEADGTCIDVAGLIEQQRTESGPAS